MSTMAKEVFAADFGNAPVTLKNWMKIHYNSASGGRQNKVPTECLLFGQGGGSKQPLLIASPTAESWTFIGKKFSPAELSSGKKVRVTADIITNNPGNPRLMVVEGCVWGDGQDMKHFAGQSCSMPMQWQRVTVELDRLQPNLSVGVALGLDYRTAGTWMVIDKVTVECADQFLPHREVPTGYEVKLPFAVLNRGNSEEFKNVLAMGKRMAKSLDDAQMGKSQTVKKFKAQVDRLSEISAHSNFLSINDLNTMAKLTEDLRQTGLLTQIVPGLTPFHENHPLSPGQNTDQYQFIAAQNAMPHATLLLRNNTNLVQSYQLELSGDLAKFARLYYLDLVESTPDHLRRLDADAIVTLGKEQTGGVEIMLPTHNAAPGIYRGILNIKPYDGQIAERQIALTLQVFPVKLPEQMPITVFNWDFSSAVDPAVRDFLLASRSNAFHVALHTDPVHPDFTTLEQVMKSIKDKMPTGSFKIFIEVWFVREKGGWKPEYTQWLDRLVARTAELGLNYQDWYLIIYDESMSDEFLSTCKAIRKHNPKIRIFSDHMFADAAIVKKFVPYVAAWCPIGRDIGNPHYAESIKVMRDSKLPFYTYECDSWPTDKLNRYRLLPWRAFQMKLDGCNFWTATPCELRASPKRIPVGVDGRIFRGLQQENYGMFYYNKKGEVEYSRRWVQWHTGLEDYLLLYAAQQKAKDKPGLQQMIDAAVKDVFANTQSSPEKIDQIIEGWSIKILKKLSE